MNTLQKIAFGIGAGALTLTGCAGSNQIQTSQRERPKSLIEQCVNKLDLCAREGYDNFAAIGEGNTKQMAFNVARRDITMQIARYLHGSQITDSQTTITTSFGRASEIPQTGNYKIRNTKTRVTQGKIPKINWEYECSTDSNKSKCYVIGYIPR